MSKRQLIVNADDFGFDEDTCMQTEMLMKEGIVRSATLMTGMIATERALAFARDHQNELSFGLHFNIAEGQPQGDKPLPSLVQDSGEFNGPCIQRLRCLAGLARPEEIANELAYQLAQLYDCGLRLTHVDSHGHLHKFPAVVSAMLPVIQHHGIKYMRRPQNLYQRRRPLTRLLNRYCSALFPQVASTDHCCGIETPDPQAFERLVENFPFGTTEMAIHPGQSADWRRSESLLVRERLPGLIRQHGISNICFHQI